MFNITANNVGERPETPALPLHGRNPIETLSSNVEIVDIRQTKN
jgi:hypothetical protein